MDFLFKLMITNFNEITEIRVYGNEIALERQITAVEELLKDLKSARPLVKGTGDGDGRNE